MQAIAFDLYREISPMAKEWENRLYAALDASPLGQKVHAFIKKAGGSHLCCFVVGTLFASKLGWTWGVGIFLASEAVVKIAPAYFKNLQVEGDKRFLEDLKNKKNEVILSDTLCSVLFPFLEQMKENIKTVRAQEKERKANELEASVRREASERKAMVDHLNSTLSNGSINEAAFFAGQGKENQAPTYDVNYFAGGLGYATEEEFPRKSQIESLDLLPNAASSEKEKWDRAEERAGVFYQWFKEIHSGRFSTPDAFNSHCEKIRDVVAYSLAMGEDIHSALTRRGIHLLSAYSFRRLALGVCNGDAEALGEREKIKQGYERNLRSYGEVSYLHS
jgi:hypothetical protein